MISGRIERKFLIDESILPDIRRKFALHLFRDGHCSDDQPDYTVRSIYLDTPMLRFYHEKHAGILHRRKLRIRGYDRVNGQDNPGIFLEIKEKYNAYIRKYRGRVLLNELHPVLSGNSPEREAIINRRDGEQADIRRFLFHMNALNLSPTVLVVYEREAFFYRHNPGLRITFDKNLRGLLNPVVSDLFSDQGFVSAIPGKIILEVKYYATLPGWLGKILSGYSLQRQALSKYTMCLEAQPRQLGLRPRFLNHFVR